MRLPNYHCLHTYAPTRASARAVAQVAEVLRKSDAYYRGYLEKLLGEHGWTQMESTKHAALYLSADKRCVCKIIYDVQAASRFLQDVFLRRHNPYFPVQYGLWASHGNSVYQRTLSVMEYLEPLPVGEDGSLPEDIRTEVDILQYLFLTQKGDAPESIDVVQERLRRLFPSGHPLVECVECCKRAGAKHMDVYPTKGGNLMVRPNTQPVQLVLHDPVAG